MDPIVIPRSQHNLSRRDVDPDALKVLYRLKDANYTAYLVGGSVRDLLLHRKPKDFDIGTSAHPFEIKRLFRNCWIIGRRFRLAHVRFGTKVIEVATFRRQVLEAELGDPGSGMETDRELADPDSPPAEHGSHVSDPQSPASDPRLVRRSFSEGGSPIPDPRSPTLDRLIHRDNTFGTPEEDAFRRDFTINALFYDIASFAVIDYVGGLEDLRAGMVRSIGNPDERFQEDPVRMQRAIALATRLGFQIEPRIYDSIARHRTDMARAAPPRLLEEYYKILRSGTASPTFQALEEVGLLRPVSRELHEGANDRLWHSLDALDAYRRRFDVMPETLTNAILLGSLVVPLGLWPPPRHDAEAWRNPRIQLGALPVAKGSVERLRQIISLQGRLLETDRSPRTMAALVHRSAFHEALTWLEIHGDAPDAVAHWKGFLHATEATEPRPDQKSPRPRRRRRRRRGFNV